MKRLFWAVTFLITLTLSSATAHGATWDANADGDLPANDQWGTGDNWVAGVPPASGEAVYFNDDGASGTWGTTTSTLEGNYSIGSLTFTNKLGLYHTLSLNGNTLVVDGNLRVGRTVLNSADPANNKTSVLIDGSVGGSAFQVGTSSSRRDIEIARTDNLYQQVAATNVVSGGSFVGWLQNVRVGYLTHIDHNGASTRSLLDLSGTSVTTDGLANEFRVAGDLVLGYTDGVNGVLKLPTSVTKVVVGGNLQMGYDFHRKIDTTGTLDFSGAGTALTTLQVTGDFQLRNGKLGYDSGGGNYVLPNSVALLVGSSGSPKEMRVGYSDSGNSGASLVMGSSGTVTAYLTSLMVGKYNGSHGAVTTGTLDLRNNAIANLSMSNLEVGTFGPSIDPNGKDPRPKGYLYLPAGDVSLSTAKIGDYVVSAGPTGNDYATGLLQLEGTHLSIANSLTVNERGQVIVKVSGDSTGLDFASSNPADFDVNLTVGVGTGNVHVVFLQDPADYPLWGIKMPGNQSALFGSYLSDGRLTWDGSALNITNQSLVGVYYNAGGDFTFFGLQIPEPGTALLLAAGALVMVSRRRH